MSFEGKQFSHYRILQLVGRGGMGEVYLVEDIQIQRQVAAKVLRIEDVQPGDEIITNGLRQFLREATTIARLDHPHILSLYDYGETMLDGSQVAYLIIPYRPEGSLVTWLRKRAQFQQSRHLTLKQVVHVIGQAGQALQYAHNHQIMHLDVKPANFLIRSHEDTDEYPDLLLSDFGIARLASTTSSASQSARGTPTYMAPEQCISQPEFASDQYALAIMAYELLTGKPPFQGAPMSVMFAHLHEQPKLARDLNSLLPLAVDNTLQRALAKKPEERFPSIAAFTQAFQEAFQDMDEATTLRSLHPSPVTPKGPEAPSTGDVHAMLAISTQEARTGTSRTLTLASGRAVNVQIPPGVQPGQVLTLIGQGEPLGPDNTTGNLYLTLSIIEPQEQTPTAVSSIASTARRSEPVQLLPPEPAVVPPPSQPARWKSPAVMRAATVALILIIISALLFIHNSPFATTTASVNATATAPANTPTTAPVNMPATAPVSTTATAPVNTPVTVSGTNPYGGTLVLNDPLQDNSRGYNWTVTGNDKGSCQFVQGAYHVNASPNWNFGCLASPDFSNFAFEVQMTIIKGGAGGITFRLDTVNQAQVRYIFHVDKNGNYDLGRYEGTSASQTLISPVLSSAVHTGLGQTNLIAVVARGSTITLYVNRQQIASVTDSTYSHGKIAVLAKSTDGNAAEVAYSNARVWSL